MDKAQKHWERIQQKKKRETEQISAACNSQKRCMDYGCGRMFSATV
jgi:hypothetical protein